MNDTSHRCLDCTGPMFEIQIIDRGGAVERRGFEYAASDAERGRWTGAFPVEGRLFTYLCRDCGAVRLFGH